jgi:hypothetical protein
MKKTLVITGAGASYSLGDDKPIYHFSYGKLDHLPLGNQLVERIANYSTKSICWLISSLIHEEIFGYDSRKWNNLFYYLGDRLEKNFTHFDDFFVLNEETREELRNNLQEEMLKEFKEILGASKNLKDKLDLDCNYLSGEDLITKFILFEIVKNFKWNLGKLIKNPKILDLIVNYIFETIKSALREVEPLIPIPLTGILYNNGTKRQINAESIFNQKSKSYKEFLAKINEKKASKTALADYQIEIGLKNIINYAGEILALEGPHEANLNAPYPFGINVKIKNSWQEIINQNVRNKINECINLLSNIKEKSELEKIVKILKIFDEFFSNLTKFSRYNYDCFKNLSKEIFLVKAKIAEIIKTLSGLSENFGAKNHKNFDKSLLHLEGCLIAADIVKYYRPYSIDYFMMNIEQLAPWEFYEVKNNSFEKLTKKNLTERKKYIHKYTKLIIANIFGSSSLHGSFVARGNDNYFRKLRWKFLENALFYNQQNWHEKAFEEYLLKYVKIITFNYDSSLERIFWEESEINDNTKKFMKENLKHVYGQVSLEIVNEKEESVLCDFSDNYLWKGLFSFCQKEKTERMILEEKCEIKDVFNQLNKNIKWIGQENPKLDEDRKSNKKWLKEANEIYVLGFAFDKNNLYRIGLIDNLGNLEKEIFQEGEKKIFISGVNAKISILLRNLLVDGGFDFQFSTICSKVSQISFGKNIIILSENYLPEVLNKDF